MSDQILSPSQRVAQLNREWVERHLDHLSQHCWEDVVLVLPGGTGRVQGRDAVVASFRDFTTTCELLEWSDRDWHVDHCGATAVVSYVFTMKYRRAGEVWRATGRDLYVLEQKSGWQIAWRTMLDIQEQREP